MKKRFQIAGTALGLMMLASSGVAMAQESSPAAEGPALFPAGCSVIAEGLNQPRYLTVAADGTVYVTEAGDGGDEVLSAPVSPEAGTPAVGEGEGDEGPPITRGASGQVTAIAPDGTKTVVASGLPSYGGVGPVGIVENDGILTISVGGAAVDTSTMLGIEVAELPYENSIVLIDPSSGNIAPIAQLSHFEVEQNPDGTDVNPNLYQLAVGPDGMLYVTDAGGNSIYKVDPASGEAALVTVIPPLSVLMGGTPGADPASDRQPVPVGIGFDADGAMYVSLLSEGWPGPNILRVEADGSVTPVASGLGMMFGFANGPDGTLYVVEGTAGFDDTGMPLPGRVLRLDADGTLTPVVEDLFLPLGADVDANGNVYVTVNSIAFGPGEPAGMVVRCDGAAAA